MEIMQADEVTKCEAFFKQAPLCRKDTVSPDLLLRTHFVKCLSFEKTTRIPDNEKSCLFRVLALHLHRNERLKDETSKFSNLFKEKNVGIDPASFRGVCMHNIAAMKDICQADISLQDIDNADGSLILELERRSVGKYSNIAWL